MENYDLYFEELIALSAVLGKFHQMTNVEPLSKKGVVPQGEPILDSIMSNSVKNIYNSQQSLLYCVETDEFIEFVEGKPGLFVKYYAIVVLGSSKSVNDPLAIVPINQSVQFSDCNFYIDYFKTHPLNITIINCNDGKCSIKTNVLNNKWCEKCHEKFIADKLHYFLHPQINISEVPRNSIIYIDKSINMINYDDLESLVKIKKFLNSDKRKIDLIQSNINNADVRMRKIMEVIQTEKKFNQEKITKLLSIRGGSMDEYCKVISAVNYKIKIFSAVV